MFLFFMFLVMFLVYPPLALIMLIIGVAWNIFVSQDKQ